MRKKFLKHVTVYNMSTVVENLLNIAVSISKIMLTVNIKKDGVYMAKDKGIFLLKGISVDEIANISEWKKGKVESKLYRCGMLKYRLDNIYIRLMKYSYERGDLFIDINPSKIKYGEIGAMNQDIDYDEICELLDKELNEVFKERNFFQKNKYKLKMSKGEIYIDVTMPVEDIDNIFNFIRKIKIPKMKREYKYEEDGTIYFYTGKGIKISNVVFKIYKKHKELNGRGYKLNSSLGTLRFEVVFKRRKLLADYKNINKLKNKESYTHINELYNEFLDSQIDLEQIKSLYESTCEFQFHNSIPYQFQSLYDFLIQRCNLDKKVTTKDDLIYQIKATYPKKTWGRFLCVVEFLNGETNQIELCKRSISNYKKKILDMGYHYLYHDRELRIIDFESIFAENHIKTYVA